MHAFVFIGGSRLNEYNPIGSYVAGCISRFEYIKTTIYKINFHYQSIIETSLWPFKCYQVLKLYIESLLLYRLYTIWRTHGRTDRH